MSKNEKRRDTEFVKILTCCARSQTYNGFLMLAGKNLHIHVTPLRHSNPNMGPKHRHERADLDVRRLMINDGMIVAVT